MKIVYPHIIENCMGEKLIFKELQKELAASARPIISTAKNKFQNLISLCNIFIRVI
jgi:hypothetical protein